MGDGGIKEQGIGRDSWRVKLGKESMMREKKTLHVLKGGRDSDFVLMVLEQGLGAEAPTKMESMKCPFYKSQLYLGSNGGGGGCYWPNIVQNEDMK